jgi:hypothetical protein
VPSVSVATPIVQHFGEVKLRRGTLSVPDPRVQPVFQDVRNYSRFGPVLRKPWTTRRARTACVIGTVS